MFSSEAFSTKLGTEIASELNLDNDNKEVIAYGIFVIIQMMYNILLVILFGVIFNVLIEALIASFVISILRKSSGGAHASSPGICAVVGTIVAIVIGLVSNINMNIDSIILIESIIFILSYYIVFKLAPVQSPTKPIKTKKKKRRLKKGSIIILSIYLIIVSISTILYFYINVDELIIYSICISGGVIWQVLSLTKFGYILVELIDTFLNKMFNRRGEKNEKN